MALSPRLDVRAGRSVRLLVLVERANPDVARKFREHGADLLVRPPQDVDRLAKTLHASAPDAPWEPPAPAASAPASYGPAATVYSQSKPFKRKKKKAEPIVERTRSVPPTAPADLFAPPPATPPPAAWPSPPLPPAWPTQPPWQAKGPWPPAAPPPPPPASAPPPPPTPAPLLLIEPLPEEPFRPPEPTRQAPAPASRDGGLNPDELFADAEEEPTHEIGDGTGASRSDILSPPVQAAAEERDA